MESPDINKIGLFNNFIAKAKSIEADLAAERVKICRNFFRNLSFVSHALKETNAQADKLSAPDFSVFGYILPD